ncbi:iron-sulfur cluster biosynthesis family protein [Virgibacillus halodenitrificans]|uniref:iron-sulfur cluster biosynthesis family protein n=1 Tax=Virgibacillus halodenitrificans TaxID=1482 RepID=UPI003B75C02C
MRLKLEISPVAKKKLKEINTMNFPYLLLWYDTEGCGCGVNGIPMIRFVDRLPNNYIVVENEEYKTVMEEQQATFFSDEMKLTVVNGMFRLSSPEGILNPFLPYRRVFNG